MPERREISMRLLPQERFLRRSERVPLLTSNVGEVFVKESTREAVKAELGKTLRSFVLGKKNAADTVAEIGKAAGLALKGALNEEARLEKAQDKANRLYRNALLRARSGKARPATRPGEKDYLIRGHVKNKETGEPLVGVTVEAVDTDIGKHKFVGLDITDKKGVFEILFTAEDFKERGEALPEIVFKLGADRASLNFTSTEVFKPKPGKILEATINIDPADDEAMKVLKQPIEWLSHRHLKALDRSATINKIHRQQVQAIGAVLEQNVGKLVEQVVKKLKNQGG